MSRPTHMDEDASPPDDTSRMHDALVRALDHARSRGRDALASTAWSVPELDPLDAFARAPDGLPCAFWEARGVCVAALGEVRVAELSRGAGGLDALEAARREVAASVPRGEAPLRLLGGFGFDVGSRSEDDPLWAGFGRGRFGVPELTLTRPERGALTEARLVLTVSPDDTVASAWERMSALRDRARRLVRAASDGRGAERQRVTVRDPEAEGQRWAEAVGVTAAALREARDGLRKVVLSRRVTAEADARLRPAPIVRRLRARYPDCARFAFAPSGADGRVFLGATPETLIRREGAAVWTEALAGSAPVDAPLDTLTASPKERMEHALVVEAIEAALRPYCAELDVPQTPSVLRLSNIHHLHTPIQGVLTEPISVVTLAHQLHPTPAICGLPTEAARAWIKRVEGALNHHRGWYTGAVGWLDTEGDGHLGVAIRSAMLDGARAHLFAGAGIVPDSQPQAELRETRLKLRAMAHALTGEGGPA